MLHTVNKSPFRDDTLESCLRFSSAGDSVLLLEDGVFGALASTSRASLVEDALKDRMVYAIRADIKARGLDRLIEGVQVIDYDVFVDLVENNMTHAWL